MRIKHLLNFFVATVFIGVAVGCAEKDLYDPNYGKEPVKGPEEYFGFETRGDVSLDVNYALPGSPALLLPATRYTVPTCELCITRICGSY